MFCRKKRQEKKFRKEKKKKMPMVKTLQFFRHVCNVFQLSARVMLPCYLTPTVPNDVVSDFVSLTSFASPRTTLDQIAEGSLI